MKKKFPAAMPPPTSDLTYITSQIVEDATQMSQESPRKRIIYPFHKKDEDTLHRMFNVVQPKTYIVPHYHLNEQKSESIIVLKGGIRFITFYDDGKIKSYQNVYAGSNVFGVDLEPSVIHTFLVLEPDTVIFEVKPGPYVKSTDKSFMDWAPKEDDLDAEEYLNELLRKTENE
ncbi:cupin fold metalloprotein, WbuC family [Pustulibacterium marinum]|uniref:Cupin fold metalloprotein, WbuC family n=1 Tax=Pustulibacterium marinum TaxID=1224947 RepID=A0A1I7IH84_9FLAO|nr:WbuC family cupin fold metalloprotein [Pustulibacterium marinum]SFU72281.1 cupin fold metalloprotein, WbuC family [Pustulibacterium marinum]